MWAIRRPRLRANARAEHFVVGEQGPVEQEDVRRLEPAQERVRQRGAARQVGEPGPAGLHQNGGRLALVRPGLRLLALEVERRLAGRGDELDRHAWARRYRDSRPGRHAVDEVRPEGVEDGIGRQRLVHGREREEPKRGGARAA
jgi:hypothetical protein